MSSVQKNSKTKSVRSSSNNGVAGAGRSSLTRKDSSESEVALVAAH
jgi:hypothetical protein